MKHIAKEVVASYYKHHDDYGNSDDEDSSQCKKQARIAELIGMTKRGSANYLYGHGGVSFNNAQTTMMCDSRISD